MGTAKDVLSKEIDLRFWRKDEEKIFTNILIVSLLSIPVVELISEIIGRTYFYQESLVRGIGIILFAISLCFFFTKKKHIFVVTDLFIALSVVFAIISIIFSQDLEASLTGVYAYQAEDPLQVLAYFMIFFMATQIKEFENIKKILLAVILVAILHSIPGFLQHFDLWPYDAFLWRQDPGSYGLAPHYNHFAALMVMFSAMATILFIQKKVPFRWLWFIMSVFFFLVTMYTWCRLAWVGLFAYLVFIPIFELYQRKKKIESIISTKYLLIIFGAFVLVCIFLIIFDEVITSQFIETTKEVAGEEGTNLGNGRKYIWTVGLYAVKDHLFTGIGFDNYVDAFYIRADLRSNWVAYKGHNEYLHMLVTQGIFSAINYVFLCMFVFFFGCKRFLFDEKINKQKVVIYIFLAMIIAYFAQAFFNNSVTNVAPYKWLVMGLLVPRASQKVLWQRKKEKLENE